MIPLQCCTGIGFRFPHSHAFECEKTVLGRVKEQGFLLITAQFLGADLSHLTVGS